MKKRTAFIAGILSLLPLGQPVLIKSGFSLLTVGSMFSISEKLDAETINYFYPNSVRKQRNSGYFEGAIEDYSKDIEINQSYQISSLARSTAVEIILPLKSGLGSGVIIEKKGSHYTILTAMHLFEDIDSEIPFTIRTADYSFYKVKKQSIKQIKI